MESDFRKLTVWKKSMDIVEDIYRVVKSLPKEETYALSDQLRRAAVSVPSNIAEGHGRGSNKEFMNFLAIARGSLHELETQLLICNRLSYLSLSQTENILSLIEECDKMIYSLIKYRRSLTSPT